MVTKVTEVEASARTQITHLVEEINHLEIDKLRKKIAESGYKKYHKFMNNKIVSDYILNCVGLNKSKKTFWHNKI